MKLVLDTMVLLNFARAERLELLACLSPHVGQMVAQELRYWPVGTRREKTLINLRSALPEANIVALDSRAELETFARFRALGFGAGEAECAALAAHRPELAIATDDERARKILDRELPDVELSSTVRILGHLIERGSLPAAQAQTILDTMRSRGGRLPDMTMRPERLTVSSRPRKDDSKGPRQAAATPFTLLSKAVPPALNPSSGRQRRR